MPSPQLKKEDTLKTIAKQDSSSKTLPKDTAKTDSSTAARPDTVKYEAAVIEYDIKNKIILLNGNAIVRYKQMTLFADTIHFLFSRNLLVATGLPQLIEGTDTVVGENMVYNLSTGRGRVTYGSAHSSDSRYDGITIARSGDRSYYIEEGDYSSCAVVDTPHYCFYGKNIKITPNDKAICRPFVLNVGEAPVAALPYFIVPLDRGRSSGWLTPRWGGNPSSGGYLDNIGRYWAPNDYMDFTLAGKISEFASYVLSANANYALRYKFSGGISGRYSLSTAHDTLNNLWAIDYAHNQNILPDESMKLSGRGSIVSGKSFYKSLSEDTAELLNQQINANMSLTKNFTSINGYSAVTWNRNHNFKTNIVDQELPSFSFNLSSRPLIPSKKRTDDIIQETVPGTAENEKWYNSISYSYGLHGVNKYTHTTEEAKEQSESRHAGFTHGIPFSASLKILKYFSLNPRLSVEHSVFDAYIDTTPIHDTLIDTIQVVVDSIKIGDTIKYIYADSVIKKPVTLFDTTHYYDDDFHFTKAQVFSWQTGVDLSTNLYGIFPIRMFGLTGLRHTLSPRVGYSFIPKSRTNTDKRYPGISIPANQPLRTQQLISFSIDNLLQAKVNVYKNRNDPKEKPEEKKPTLLTAGISGSYDFMGEKRKLSNISLGAGIPNPIINFSYSSTFTPYNEKDALVFPRLLSYNIDLRPNISGANGTFWSGDLLLYHGLKTKKYMEGYNLTATNPGWSVTFSPRFSFSRSRLTILDDFTTTKTYYLGTSASVKFTNIWSMSWGGTYNFSSGKFENHSVNFQCDLECWDLSFNWSPSGFNQGAFYFIVKIKKHPEIKWERRDTDR